MLFSRYDNRSAIAVRQQAGNESVFCALFCTSSRPHGNPFVVDRLGRARVGVAGLEERVRPTDAEHVRRIRSTSQQGGRDERYTCHIEANFN